MVQKNIENFNEYRTVYSGTAMPVGDKQQPVAAKKVALRELSQNTFIEPPENSSVPKERGSAWDVAKTYNVKRQKPSLYSPPSLPPGCTGPNGHIVYVRRKLNKEAKKIVAIDKVNSVVSGKTPTPPPMRISNSQCERGSWNTTQYTDRANSKTERDRTQEIYEVRRIAYVPGSHTNSL